MQKIKYQLIEQYLNVINGVNVVWWIWIILAILTWAAGAAICWWQHGFVDQITWNGIHCHR